MVRRSPWPQILVLALVGVFAVLDRQILVLLIEPVKRDLQISDTQVGLLVGGAFVIFYTAVALPLSRLADRWSRRGVIMAGVLVWGLMTCACGFASGFWQLFVTRMGVGFGEAAYSPAAYALTAEMTPRRRWGVALGALMLSAAVGYGLALLGGAAILDLSQRAAGLGVSLPGLGRAEGWQLVFLVCGGLTLLTLPLLALIRPPSRPTAAEPVPGAVWRRLWRERPAYAAIFLAIPPSSLVAYGILGWLPSFLVRAHALSPVAAGATVGLLAIVLGGAGIVAGALGLDWLGRRRADAPILVLAAAVGLTLFAALLLPVAASGQGALLVAGLICFAIGLCTPIPPVAIQAITPGAHRARVSAAYLFVSGLMGIGGGPLAVGLLTDHVFRDEAAVGASMAVAAAIGGGLSLVLLMASRAAYGRLAGITAASQNSEG
jgi:MFS family permease